MTTSTENSLYSPPPAEQVYACYLPGRYVGYAVEKYFATRFPYMNEGEWIGYLEEGRITVNGDRAVAGMTLKAHDHIITRMGMRQEPPADRRLRVIYEDAELRVFNKGAPLPVHPSGRYFQNSMTEILKETYRDEIPRPVQRLDVLTTGLIVFARSKETARRLTTLWENISVHKEYLALVHGKPKQKRFTVDAPVGKSKGSTRAAGEDIENAKSAFTEFEWLQSQDGLSLLRAVPRTGRTNQIRVHLAHVGLPLWNDPVYGHGQADALEFGLHAWRLQFDLNGQVLDLKAPWPDHFQPFIQGTFLQEEQFAS